MGPNVSGAATLLSFCRRSPVEGQTPTMTTVTTTTSGFLFHLFLLLPSDQIRMFVSLKPFFPKVRVSRRSNFILVDLIFICFFFWTCISCASLNYYLLVQTCGTHTLFLIQSLLQTHANPPPPSLSLSFSLSLFPITNTCLLRVHSTCRGQKTRDS